GRRVEVAERVERAFVRRAPGALTTADLADPIDALVQLVLPAAVAPSPARCVVLAHLGLLLPLGGLRPGSSFRAAGARGRATRRPAFRRRAAGRAGRGDWRVSRRATGGGPSGAAGAAAAGGRRRPRAPRAGRCSLGA